MTFEDLEPGIPAPLPLIFHALSRVAIPLLRRHGVKFSDRVFGLRETGRMRTETIARVLENLPDGISELYFHPGAEPAPLDLPRLAELAARQEIMLASSAVILSKAKDR